VTKIPAGGETLWSEIHKSPSNSIWNKEEFLDQWKESIIEPIYRKGDKTECSNYRGISLLSISYKILSNVFLSKLSPYTVEIIGDHQRRFRRKRSTTDQIMLLQESCFVTPRRIDTTV
jgi:hypothetical protein